MINYMIELAIVHLILTLGYFLLRKERQYSIVRLYLIGSTIIALLIPLFKLPRLIGRETAIESMPVVTNAFNSVAVTPPDTSFRWSGDLLIYVYILFSAFFLYKFLHSILTLIQMRRKSNCEKSGGIRICKIQDGITSFSFCNWIFISEDIDKDKQVYQLTLEHEKAHVFFGHSYDIIFLQLFKVSFWWLPTAWFFINEIKKVHEYQADAYVLRTCSIEQYSSILISSTLRLNGIGLVSSFHDGLILKRLIAMKQQTKKVSTWKLVALSSLCAVLFTAFACSEEQNSKVADTNRDGQLNKDIFVVVEELPEAKGGMNNFYSHIKNEVKYPTVALQKRLEGRVDVEFIVNKDGSLSDVSVLDGVGEGCGKEAVNAVRSSPSFKPASQRGMPVRVRMVVPIMFKLDNDERGTISVGEIQPKNSTFKVNATYNNGEWSGEVFDEEGEPLPGVNIIVSETTTGTVSNMEGGFKVKADESKDLYLSFVGYESVRLKGEARSR